MKTIDLHCDTISRIYDENKKGNNLTLLKNNLQIDIAKLIRGDYMLQCFAMFVYLKDNPNPFEHCIHLIDQFYQEMESCKEYIRPVKCYQDILDNQAQGKISALLTIEEGGVTQKDLAYLRTFYNLGVRLITLNWNFPNGIGYPNFSFNAQEHKIYNYPNTINGLTEYGIEMVKEMNRLGMIIDVSHLSDAGFYDVAKYSTKPFIASHSNAREKCWFPRNLTDDMIRVLSSKRGIIGINFCRDFLVENHEEPMIRSLVKHIKHIRDIGGIDCLAMGTDFDGISPTDEIKDASEMNKLVEALRNEKFSEDEIEKIFYKNALRLIKEVIG